MNWKKVVKIYAVVIAIVSASLVFAPALAQAMGGEDTYSAEKAENVVHVVSAERQWTRTDENRVAMSLTPQSMNKVHGFNLHCYWEISESVDRVTVITYDIYANDVFIERWTHTLENLGGGRGTETYDITVIPAERLKPGDNSVRVVITVDSTASETPRRNDDIKLVFRNAQVKEILIDSDGDGLNDDVDPLKGLNNYTTGLVVSVLMFMPVTAAGIERKK